MTRRIPLWLTLLTLLAIGVRVLWGVTHIDSAMLNVNLGDYDLYEDGAQYWLENRDFANSLFLVRPPLFSLIIAALGTDRFAVLMLNALVGGLTTPLVYALARRFDAPESVALAVAGVYALDFVSVFYGGAILDGVAIANAFALLMWLALLALAAAENRTRAMGYGLLAGVAFLLSAFTRTDIYLIWTGLAVWLLITTRGRYWMALAAYVVVSVAGIGGWAAHNGRVFGNPTFSTVSGFTMAFYRAASVERIGSGDDIETVYMNITRRVEAAVGNDPDAATPDTRWGYHAAPPDVEDALVQVSLEIFREYPLVTLATYPVGFVRMYNLDPTFMRAADEPLWLNGVVAWNWVLLVGAVGGLVHAARQKRWLLFWAAFLAAGYYTTGTLLVKNAGMVGRERTPLTPFMVLLAVWWLYDMREQASNRRV